MPEAWDTEENTPNGLYAFHKDFGDGPDVFVAVNKVGSAYEVRETWVTSTSEPQENVKGTFKTLEEAKAAASAETKNWDARYAKPKK